MSGISRRRLLAATGVGLTGSVAGCLGSDDGNGSEDESESENGTENGEEDETDEGRTVSGAIIVDNLDDSAHTVDILVELDREIEDWVTETISADDTATLERDWSSDRDQFRVTARLNGGEPVDITPPNWNESDCLSIFVRVTGPDAMTHSSNTSGARCGEVTDDPDDAE